MLNEETLKIYLKMHEILSRKYFEEKSPIYEAAKAMITAIDECGNIPERY